MSEPSSYDTFESEEESSGLLMTSESAFDDEDDLSDELTLLNGDENSDEESSLDDEFIRLSQRLKEKYNLQEATVGLERCDKIWETMQLLKKVQRDYGFEDDADESDEIESSGSTACVPNTANSSVPYIKYQPVQGNGNNALPNFYLAVKSQRKVYHCVTCGRQYNERRSLRVHSAKVHGVVLPPKHHKTRTTGETRNLRPRTPCDFGLRSGRDSILDEKIVQNSPKQISTDTEDSVGDTMVAATKGTDSKELNELLGIVHDCPLCPATFTNRKRLCKHSYDFHAMSVKKATEARLMNRKTASSKRVTGGKGSRNSASSSESLSDASKSGKNLPSTNRSRKFGNRMIRMIDGVQYRWRYTCKLCDKNFLSRKSLRTHARRHHGHNMPAYKVGGFLAAVKNSEIFGAELVKIDDEVPKTRSGKTFHSKNNISNKGRVAQRPKRACAVRTSYTECTKEEEAELQRTLAGIPSSPPKTSPSQTIKCFLCKRSFVDMRKHLVDYHRISAPESILPLRTIAGPDEGKNRVASEAPLDVQSIPKEEKISKSKRNGESALAAIEAGDDPRVKIVLGAKRRKAYQCAVCLYKYKHLPTIVKHLKSNTVNGVLKDHTIYVRRSSNKRSEDKDPLATTDNSDATKSNCNTSEDDDSSSVVPKMMTSSSDERLTPSPEPRTKRRKIEDSETDVEAIGSESRTDCTGDNVEEESVIELSESDSRSVEEAKFPKDREARDSSDRDSGIGISITIKKRNDSYEVVGMDNKTMEFENSKDDNDSSSDFMRADFVSDDRVTDRPCEIVNSNDCSKDEDVLGTMRTDGDDVDNENETEDRCTSTRVDNNYRWMDKRCREEACDRPRGNVPSLIVLSRTALTESRIVTVVDQIG